MKERKKYLLTEFASRNKVDVFNSLYKALPDPDKILEENNYDYDIYRDLLNDPHLMATVQQRKMQVMQMGWELECDPSSLRYAGQGELIKEKVMKVMRALPLNKIMSDVLDAVFFGFNVGEIEWKKEGREIIPVDVIGKPQEWFIFTRDNELRLRKYREGQYYFEEGEKLPEYKFILTQYKPTYTNPYGKKVLSDCYWAVHLKRGGIEYWQLMMERYGMPYLMGRYPNTFTEVQKDEFLEQLKQMVEDNITIFEETLGIEIKESPQYDVGQLYENLVNFHNKEISKAVLTVTLTTEIEKVGSYKASDIHREMLSYLGVSDKKMVERALNTLLGYYVKLNFGDVPLPRVKLNKKEAVVEESAERDKILSEIGVKFSKEYFMKRYNLGEGDFEINKQKEN
jgi:phage gp29-like protein